MDAGRRRALRSTGRAPVQRPHERALRLRPLACLTAAVLDRRDSSMALAMSPATMIVDGVQMVDLEHLADVPDVKLGALRLSVTLPLQATIGDSGAKTVQARGQ